MKIFNWFRRKNVRLTGKMPRTIEHRRLKGKLILPDDCNVSSCIYLIHLNKPMSVANMLDHLQTIDSEYQYKVCPMIEE